MLIGGAAGAEEACKVTTNAAKTEGTFAFVMSQHLDRDLFTDVGLIYPPFPPKGRKVLIRTEFYFFVKHCVFFLHFQLELAVQYNAEDTFPHTMVFLSGCSWHPERLPPFPSIDISHVSNVSYVFSVLLPKIFCNRQLGVKHFTQPNVTWQHTLKT